MLILIITNITYWITEGQYLLQCYLQSRDPLEVKLPRMLVEIFAVNEVLLRLQGFPAV